MLEGSQESAEAAGRVVLPFEVVEKLRIHGRRDRQLLDGRLRILDDRRIAAGGPLDAAPLREHDGRLESRGEIAIGLLEGVGRQGLGLRLVAAGPLGGGHRETDDRVVAGELGPVGERVDSLREAALDGPDKRRDRVAHERVEACVAVGDGLGEQFFRGGDSCIAAAGGP